MRILGRDILLSQILTHFQKPDDKSFMNLQCILIYSYIYTAIYSCILLYIAIYQMSEQFEEIQIVSFGQKKKKKKVAEVVAQKEQPKKVIDHDNQYGFLLRRIIQTLTKNNPDLAEQSKITLDPPQVVRIGKKKTAITNFTQLCAQLDRHPQHVMNFFVSELGKKGSIGNAGFVIKTIFQQAQTENLFRKYIVEYVQCTICKRQKTELVKDHKMKLWTIHCRNCKCTRTVPTLKGAEKKYQDWQRSQDQTIEQDNDDDD